MPRPGLPRLPEDVWADEDPLDPENQGHDPDDYYDRRRDG